jgi:ribosomal protein L3 glutamine methyltransferase
MLLNYYKNTCKDLHSVADFIRFFVHEAQKHEIFCGHGRESIYDDIYCLILELLSLPLDAEIWLLTAQLSSAEKNLLCEKLSRRILERIPSPYLSNKAYFCDLEFYVDKRVLIPRSPIAELINNKFSPLIDSASVSHILDLCTGSACIAIACCYAFPESLVDAADLSLDALAVAEHNLKKHNLEHHLTLYHSNVFAAIPHKQYDIIVSNPPYVGFAEMQTLPQEYLHEPKMALEAENNGLAIVTEILKLAPKYLSDDGILVVEVGNSADNLANFYPDLPFTWLDFEYGGSGVFVLTKEDLDNYAQKI